MKYLIALCLLAFAGCSSAPTKIMVKNCESLGSGLYECEEIPRKAIEPHGGR